MKKLLSLVLALMLVIGLFAGCNNGTPDDTKAPGQTNAPEQSDAPEQTTAPEELEPVTLKWYMDEAEKEGSADVLEAFNAKLAEVLPNTTLEIVYVSDYKTNWPLLLAGGEAMDIAWAGWKTPMEQDTLDGNFTALNELVEEYGPNIAEHQSIWVEAYNSGTKDGTLWMIPCVQPTVPESQSMNVHDVMVPYFDMDAFVAELRSNSKMTTKMLDLVEEAYEAAIADGALVPGSDDWYINGSYFAGQIGCWGYLTVGGEGYQMRYDPEAENPVPMHTWEIPEVKEAAARVAEWYDRGWITENNILNQRPETSRQTFSFNQAWNQNWGQADENGIVYEDTKATAKDGQGYYRILTNRPEEGYKGTTIYGKENTYMVIPYTSENPERAMMLLNLLHDEPGTVGNDLFNLLCYGFEKNSEEAKTYGWYNYEAVEQDGQLVRVAEAEQKHAITNWKAGNTYKVMSDGSAMLSVSSKDYCMNFYTEIYPNLASNPITGFAPDYSEVTDQVSAYKAVVTEYQTQLYYGTAGAAGFEALYEEFMNKMNAAGLEEVKAELQAQIDAYAG